MFVIHYDNGEIERTDVSRQTYDRYDEGEGISFAKETDWNKIYHLFMAIGTLLSLIGDVICATYSFEADFD